MPILHDTPELRLHWWKALFESSEDAQLVCDSDGTIREFNAKAALLLELNFASTYTSVLEFFTNSTAEQLKQALAGEGPVGDALKSVSLLSGGRIRQLIDITAAQLDKVHWLVTLKDASRRWRMESHVNRLGTALDATPDVFFLTDSDYNITYVNTAFQTVTGHTIEDALGRTAEFLRSPESRPRIQEYIKAIEAGTDWVGEIQNLRKDGSKYRVEATIAPIYTQTGQLIGYVACERDIEQKKKMAEALLQERNYARSILNSIDSAVFSLDQDFRIIQTNGTAQALPNMHGWLDLQHPVPNGTSLLSLVKDPLKRTELRIAFENVFHGAEPMEMCGASPDGKHWSVKISPWEHNQNIVGLIYQVTDQSKMNELRNALYQAQKVKTIGSLAAGIAHDFNNLLLVIRGNVTMLLMEREERETEVKYLKNIEQAAGQAAEITQQLLSFSRASKQRVIVFDMNTTLQDVAKLVSRSIKPNIQIITLSSDTAVKVQMDPSRAHQMVLNLCVNAQDAMPKGGKITLSNTLVRLTRQQAAKTHYPADTPFVRCSVSDTGTGIPMDIRDRIFDPFFTTKDPGKGTGLGLSIVHGVVTEAGGFLELDSALGVGTTFHAYFPAVDDEITSFKRKEDAGSLRGQGKILVVEDIELVREFTVDFLEHAGFTVAAAANGAEALEKLEAEAFDLIFTDFNMPGTTGLELLQQVQARWPEMKRILSSGYLEDAVHDKAVNHLRALTLRKPYTVEEAIHAIVGKLIEKS